MIFACVPRNFGSELMRIDVSDGRAFWVEPALLPSEPFELRTAGIGNDRIYVAAGNELSAISIADGRRLWSLPLPRDAAKWRTIPAGPTLLLRPDFEQRFVEQDSAAIPFGPPLARLATPSALVNAGVRSYHAWMDRPFAVLLVDSETGQLLQRLNFPEAGRLGAAVAAGGGLTVVTGRGACRLAGNFE